METNEEVESVPWGELLNETTSVDERRRLAYLAVGLVGAVILGVLIARAWWSPGTPTVVSSVDSVVETPAGVAVTAASTSTALLYSEADLMADPIGSDPQRSAQVRAEWFVSDYFTADFEPDGSADVRAALPPLAELPPMPQDATQGISYVEWARAFAVSAQPDGTYLVSVAFRALGAPAEGSFTRMPVRAVEVAVAVGGDGATVIDLPRPIPVPPGPEPPAWPQTVAEPPPEIVDLVAARASVWGEEPRIISAGRVNEGWRVVVTVADDVGNRWPLAMLISA